MRTCKRIEFTGFTAYYRLIDCAMFNVQDEEEDEVSADSSQNSEDGVEEDEEVDAVDQWHPRNPYQVRMDLPDVLTDALI